MDINGSQRHKDRVAGIALAHAALPLGSIATSASQTRPVSSSSLRLDRQATAHAAQAFGPTGGRGIVLIGGSSGGAGARGKPTTASGRTASSTGGYHELQQHSSTSQIMQPTFSIDFTPSVTSQGSASASWTGNSMRSINTLSPNVGPSHTFNKQKDRDEMSQQPQQQQLGIRRTQEHSQHQSSQQSQSPQQNTSLNNNKLDTPNSATSSAVSGAPFLRKKSRPKRNDRFTSNDKNISATQDCTSNPSVNEQLIGTSTNDNIKNSCSLTDAPSTDNDVVIIESFGPKKVSPSSSQVSTLPAPVTVAATTTPTSTSTPTTPPTQIPSPTPVLTQSSSPQASAPATLTKSPLPVQTKSDESISQALPKTSKEPISDNSNKFAAGYASATAFVLKNSESQLPSSNNEISMPPGSPLILKRSSLAKQTRKEPIGSNDESIKSKDTIVKPQETSNANGLRLDSQVQKPQEPQQQQPPHQQQDQQQKLKSPQTARMTPKASASGVKHWVGWFTPAAVPFSWDIYLKISPAETAPKEAFRQSYPIPENKFKINMKLEAKDPRNPGCWCLASVISVEGLRLRLRFDGSDTMNDLFELIDSANIRSIGSRPTEPLLPPMAYKGNLAFYAKFVEKVLSYPDTVIAPPEIFPPVPSRPEKNLFKPGMKLEAIDRKHREWICPATIGEVVGNNVKIIFDGWRGSFDYSCEYYSRDLFPVNWCASTNHYIQPPHGWESLINKDPADQLDQNTLTKTHDVKITSSTPQYKCTLSQQQTKTKLQQTPTSQKKNIRGRPPKEKSVKSDVQSKMGHQTPKRTDDGHNNNNNQTRKASFSTPCSEKAKQEDLHEDLLEDLQDDNVDDTIDVNDRFQCQRAVPYGEWHKKKLENQMPRDSQDNSSNSDHLDVHNSSFNQSDSASQASTVSYQDNKESGNSSHGEGGHTAKRVRLESPSDTSSRNRRREIIKSKPNSISLWTVRDVLDLIETDETLAKYSNVFTEHEIDGKAFILLTTDMMINHMGLKIGPVLKINDFIEQVKRLK